MCLAIPGKVLSAQGEAFERTARVDFGGVERDINMSFVPVAQTGDYVLVHVGVAISVLDEDAALASLKLLEEIDEIRR